MMFLIDVIITDNTRPPSGCPQLTYYSAGGVFLALQHNGLNVRWVDLKQGEKVDKFPATNGNTADVCCYAVFFGNKVSAFSHMKEIRLAPISPRCIIAFGPFASAFPEEILSRKLADIVVLADAEFVIPMILAQKDNVHSLSAIPNLAYLLNDNIVYTQKHSFDELDKIPFISPHLFGLGERPAYMMTARGCQYHCVYCERNAMWGGGVRNRSVANVLDEVKELVDRHQVMKIEFLDEDLAADPKRLASICEGMSSIKGGLHWECSACIDSVSQKMLVLMGQSLCRSIYFGVESASPEVLRRVGKTYGRQEILNAVRWSQEAGLTVEVMITTGNPGETDLDRKLTLSALSEMGPNVKVHTNRLVILPGTPLYRKALREGWFTPEFMFEDEGLIFYDEQSQMPRSHS
jgi:radical SAM superfamily enzyme YgiQ (UPF0313 family)